MITTNKTYARDLGMYANEIREGVYYIVEDAPVYSEEKEKTSLIKNLKVRFTKLLELVTARTCRMNNISEEVYLMTEGFTYIKNNDIKEEIGHTRASR